MNSFLKLGDILDNIPGDAQNITHDIRMMSVGGICIDSRKVNKDDVFVAIKGPRHDGHDYINEVIKSGACLVILERALPISIAQIIVKDTFYALGALGKLYRSHFLGKVFGITGSCGKTSVKEMIAGIFDSCSTVLFSFGNLNNGFGVPLMLGRLSNDYQYAVIEMGTSAPGEIKYLTSLVLPNVAVITNAAESHLLDLGSVAGVAQEKGAILDKLNYREDYAVLNYDNEFYEYWYRRIKDKNNKVSILAYSTNNKKADCYATNIRIGSEGMVFTLNLKEESKEVSLKFWGEHQVQNACCAALAASVSGLCIDKIITGLQLVKPFDKRGVCYRLQNGVTLFDESYNANPCSVRAAIDLLAEYDKHKTLIIGDMLDLGDQEDELHGLIGEYAKKKGIDRLVSYGNKARLSAQHFGSTECFDDKIALVEWMEAHLKNEDVVLVKGSRGMGMEYVVHALVGNCV